MARQQLGTAPVDAVDAARHGDLPYAIPAGGLSGAVLAKASATSGDFEWDTPSELSSASTLARRNSTGQLLAATPSSSSHLATKGYVDGLVVPGAWADISLNSGYSAPAGFKNPGLQVMADGSWRFRGRIKRDAGNFVANTAYQFGTLPGSVVPGRQVLLGGGASAGGSFVVRVWVEISGIINVSASGAATDVDLSGIVCNDPT